MPSKQPLYPHVPKSRVQKTPLLPVEPTPTPTPAPSPEKPRPTGGSLPEMPPSKMTVDEFQRVWQPQGWHMLIIGPTATWKQEWGPWECIREIVQNALDETEAYQYGYDQYGLWISDYGSGISVSSFLLGPAKLKPAGARGKYGEGMKIGALAMLRMGYRMKIETAGKEIWMLFIQQEAGGLVDTLGALWRESSRRSGTIFHLIGYTDTAYPERFVQNLPKSAILSRCNSQTQNPKVAESSPDRVRQNMIIQTPPGEQHKIFSRDIYMRDEPHLLYSYNLWDFELAPDRFAPAKEVDMGQDMARAWACVNNVDMMVKLLTAGKQSVMGESYEAKNMYFDSLYMGYEADVPGRIQKSYRAMVEDNKEVWNIAWKRVYGAGAVIGTSERYNALVQHLGYNSVYMSWDLTPMLKLLILTDAKLVEQSQEKLADAKIVPDAQLPAKERAHLEVAREMAKASSANPKNIYAAIIPPASDRVRTAGLYQRSTRVVYISLQELSTLSTTVNVLVHELGHDLGGDDLTDQHVNNITKLTGELVHLTKNGSFDHLLTSDVKW